MKETPFFSIVIPTLNEEGYLPLLLEDLAVQTYQHFEVIHVDGTSEDSTVQIAEQFSKKLQLTSHITDTRNVSFQRNIGIKHAQGEWIIFMDADNRIPSYFLDGLRYQLARNQETDIFTTWVSIAGDKKLNQSIERIINFGFEFYNMLGKESAFGSMIGVRNELAKKYPFDEKQKVMEDVIFIEKITDAGNTFKIFKDPRYIYSLRRLEASGILNNVQIGTKMFFNYYVKGKDFKNTNFGYEMQGGKSYEGADGTLFNMFREIEHFIKSGPKKKDSQDKKLFKSIKKSL